MDTKQNNLVRNVMDLYDSILERLRPWAPIPLRLIVGYGFMAHGYAKIAKGPEHFIDILHNIGMLFPDFLGWATIIIELAGGLAVLLGAFVTLVSIPMIVVLIVALVTVHWPYGFSSIKLQAFVDGRAQFGQPGYETDLLYLTCIVALIVGGSGPFAVDSASSKFLKKAA